MVEAIWMERNAIVHGEAPKQINTILRSVCNSFAFYSSTQSLPAGPARWELPPTPWIKINVDAAIRAEESVGAAVARDHQGVVLAIKTTLLSSPDPITAEALAMLLGLEVARAYSWPYVVVESDCLNLLNSWNGGSEVPWQATHVFKQMRDLMISFSQVVITFVSRECNYFAHNLASWAYVCSSFDTLNPSEVSAAVCQDHFWWD
ncbi:Ribonuclease H-like domain containing protein [Trema orientale]|uniref:Ribonuclease H-like domain containing protein n=1 Tax=Trema orientale TaxID=63057 RepID=A0A2P5EZH4_TREOI|nr:Ribonuclease H-like domain containing protein [Trema orientale]